MEQQHVYNLTEGTRRQGIEHVYNLTEGARGEGTKHVYNLTEGAIGEMKTRNVYKSYPGATEDNTQFKKWSNETKNKQMEVFQFFTHCTDSNFEGRDELKPFTAKTSWQAPLSEDNAPGGVWFAMGLYEGELPTISPYGKNRLLMPWEKLINSLTVGNNKPLLFLESIQFRTEKRNVRLMLVKDDDKKTIQWCVEHHLPCLDWFQNPFMRLTLDSMMTHKNVTGVIDTWVVLLVPYTVNIKGCEFISDAVEKVGHFR